jgi:hypothetical protein
MALWRCGACGTAYAVGLPACPHCHSTDYEEDGVAKITTGGGASLHTDAPDPDAVAPADAGLVPVKEQLAAGVPPEETVTIADQRAGVPPPPAAAPAADGTPAPDTAPPA